VKAFLKFTGVLLLLAILAAVGCLVYLNVYGFPPFLKDYVVGQLARSGYAFQFSSIRLDWLRGVIASDAVLADAKAPEQTLARIDEVQLHWNWQRMMRRQSSIDALRIANATVSVPTPSDEIGPQQFTASNAYAILRIGDDGVIHLDRLTGVYCGIALHVTGLVKPRTTGSETPKKTEMGAARLAIVTKALRELNSLQITRPPQIDLDFNVDLSQPLMGQVRARLVAADFGYRRLQVQSATVNAVMRNGAIEISECVARINDGEISLDGRYDFAEGQFELHLKSTLDPTVLAVALPPGVAKALGQVRFFENPTVSASYTLSPETGTVPTLKGTVETGGLEVRGVEFRSVRFNFVNQGPEIRIADALIVTPEGHLTGHGQYHIESSDFNYAFDSTLDPRRLVPLMTPLMVRIVEPSWFETPPHIVASVRGDFVDPDAFAYDAQIDSERCSYRGVGMNGVSSQLRLRHSRLDVENLVLRREEGELRGTLLADFDHHQLSFNLDTTANPSQMSPLIGPKAVQVLRPYRFGPRTKAAGRGLIDFDRPTNTVWAIQVANEGFSYWKFTADRAQAYLTFTNNLLRIDNFDADFYGGKLQGQAVFALTNSVNYRFDFNVGRSDLQNVLTALHTDKKSHVTGTLSGHMTLSGQGSDLASLRGRGDLEIADGVLWEVPLFGIFSQILGKTKATSAKATFTIADQAVTTDDMDIKADPFTATCRGKVDFNGGLDFRVKAQFLRAWPGINILTTILEQILEYKVGGTITKPNYRAVRLPKELLPHD
jgi:hypothetical protein